jgi:tryptophanase
LNSGAHVITKADKVHFATKPFQYHFILEKTLQRTSVKDTYRDQFEKAIEVALNHINQGVSKQKVVSLLNDSGFKTRTGKRWSSAILGGELRKLSRSMNTTKE